MLPAWATVLVAIGASAVTGVIATLLMTRWRIQHEREEQLRDRMLAAADDFATGALQAQVELWEAGGAPERGSTIEERRPEALRRIAEAHARLARIHVLFGREGDAGNAATETINALWNGRHALERQPPDREAILGASGDALTRLNEFTTAARTGLERPWRLGGDASRWPWANHRRRDLARVQPPSRSSDGSPNGA